MQTAKLVSIALAASVAAPLLGSAQERLGLNFVAKITDYYDALYVDRPVAPSRHLFFVGESPAVALEIGNSAYDPLRLAAHGRLLNEAFRVSVLETPDPRVSPTLVVTEVGTAEVSGMRADMNWTDNLEVPARTAITWTAVISGVTSPGSYRLQLTPNFSGQPGPINPQATLIRFEVRDITSESDRAELARRRMMHAYLDGSESECAAAIESLLNIYPQSAAAYEIRGDLAQRAGRKQDADIAFGRALQLITLGEDRLLLSHANPPDIQALRQELQRRLTSAR